MKICILLILKHFEFKLLHHIHSTVSENYPYYIYIYTHYYYTGVSQYNYVFNLTFYVNHCLVQLNLYENYSQKSKHNTLLY